MLLKQSSHEYIKVINALVSEIAEAKKSAKGIEANITSAVKKSKYKLVPILKRPVCVWNNRNYSFDFTHISIPFTVNRKSTRLKVRALLIDKYNHNCELLKYKLGTLRITKKSAKWIAQISVTIPTNKKTGTKILGVDLSLKVPAVAITDDDKVRFFGNGRQNKFMKRKFRSVCKKLGKAKKLNALRQLDDTEQRWMQDHKVSRVIVDFATDNNISVIRLEQITNIRQTDEQAVKTKKIYTLGHSIA